MTEEDEKPTIAEEGPTGDTAVTSGDAGENNEVKESNDGQSADSAKDGANEVEEEDGEGSDGGLPKKKRLCRHPGCIRVIKSQGHCQRHGAKAKRCKVVGCDKQAQGTHDGMCKRHWKAIHFPEAPAKVEAQPPPPQGESVYDSVLPQSISYRPGVLPKLVAPKEGEGADEDDDPPPAPEGVSVMPLVAFLTEGVNRESGWHRNVERRARGMFPVSSLSSQLEPWERQLALVEILLLSGGTPYANFKDLAHAWGREKGFHHVLANSVCERRGEVERKRRSDAGRILSSEEKSAVRQKLKRKSPEVPTTTGDDNEENVKPETDETPVNREAEAAAVLVAANGDAEMAETAEMNVQEV